MFLGVQVWELRVTRIDEAVAFIERCRSGAPVQALLTEFNRLIKTFGFEVAASGAWYVSDTIRLNRFFFNTWPQDWMELYNAHVMSHVDPMVNESIRSMTSFRFSQKRDIWMRDDDQRKVIELAENYGWHEVYGVPIHGPFGYSGLISIAAYAVPDLDPIDCIMIEAFCAAFHHRCREEPGFGVGLEPRPELTARQIECLRLVALGKSDTEIGKLTGLSSATAHYHVEQAKRRLGVRSRVEAVARLILDGTI